MTWARARTQDGGIYVPCPNNALTQAEASGGYRLIWNGKDFSGWKTYGRDSVVSSFAIAGSSGTENNAPPSENPDSNVIEISGSYNTIGIFTADTGFQDFDWMIEFQTPSGRSCSSGLIYRYSERISKNSPLGSLDFPIVNSFQNPAYAIPLLTWPDSPYLNRAAASAGDTSLIDTLTFATPLFPASGSGNIPPTINDPRPLLAPIGGGILVRIREVSAYRLRLHDLRGATPNGRRKACLFPPQPRRPAVFSAFGRQAARLKKAFSATSEVRRGAASKPHTL